jgi:hypothetical protein
VQFASKQSSRGRHVLLAATLLSFSSGLAHADTPPPVPMIDTTACDPDSAARLRWLVARLESRELYADLWWRGWIGFYGLGVVIQSARAGVEDHEGKRADLIVSAVKAVGGTARLYFVRPTARLGADPLEEAPLTDPAACRERVKEGEALLEKAADESERRFDWKAHATNVAINVAGGAIVAEGFDEDDGWVSAGVGIAVGEAMLWSHPWTGRSDLEEYQAHFASGDDSRTSWAVLPYRRGLQVQMRF